MGSVDEETLWKHWMYLKNELHVEDLLEKLVTSGVFTETQQNEILHVTPNTRQMKAEKFLKVLVQSGEKGFDVFCEILRQNSDNRYQAIIIKLNIASTRKEPGKYFLNTSYFLFVLNTTTFSNISVLSWRSDLLIKETIVSGENHRHAESCCETLLHKIVSSTPQHERKSN